MSADPDMPMSNRASPNREGEPFADRTGPLPDRSDVAIIGGGVVGLAAALHLAEAGYDVALFEKGGFGAEQSSRNWGWIRKQGRDPRELPLMLRSAALWREYAARGGEFGYRVGGITQLAETEAILEERARWLVHAQDHQIETRLLSSSEVAERLGEGAPRFAGGLITPSDAFAEPDKAMASLTTLASDAGARLHDRTAVRGLVRRGGRVSGVVTERGELACDAVILAGGAWSRTFMEHLGLALPQLAVRSTAFRTSTVERFTEGPIGATGASIRPRGDGGYTIGRVGAASFDLIPAAFAHLRAFLPLLAGRWRGTKVRVGRSYFGPLGRTRWADDEASPFEAVRILDPEPDMGLAQRVFASAQRVHPALAEARIAKAWAGMIDVTPDEVPIIDSVEGLPGLVVATGLSGHGFGLGPGAGQLAAELATNRTPLVDPAPFGLARFGRPRGEQRDTA